MRPATGGPGFGGSRRGATAVPFAFAAFLLVGVTGAAIDYANVTTIRAQLQGIADAAVLAGAKEFRLGNAEAATVEQVTRAYARAALSGSETALDPTITPTVDNAAKTVTLEMAVRQPTYILHLVGIETAAIAVRATAKVIGGTPVCLIGLDSSKNKTIYLEKNAKIEAPGCSVYSNSTGPNGLSAKDDAAVKAAFICTAGGKLGAKKASFTPEPQLDCPVIPDPLAARPQPTASGCLQTDLVVEGVVRDLMPGTYCGGITIRKGGEVKLNAGVYAIKNGPLVVADGGKLKGVNVGLFLTGKGARISFETNSSVSLTAPKSGDMAGMLMFEDRTAALGQKHEITSNDTRMLLGTIYLSRGTLHVAAQSPVADKSAYTIVVANQFSLSEGPTMVLNTNYDDTNIPVPLGVGPNANRTALTD